MKLITRYFAMVVVFTVLALSQTTRAQDTTPILDFDGSDSTSDWQDTTPILD